jgi:hypothetical protein
MRHIHENRNIESSLLNFSSHILLSGRMLIAALKDDRQNTGGENDEPEKRGNFLEAHPKKI